MAKTPDSKSDKDTIRKIWLAGIGAYGRAYTEAKGAVDAISGKGSAAFDELVQKGEMLEAVGKYKAEELLGKGKAAAKDITPDLDIDDRIAKMRARLSGGSKTNEDRLAARVDQLEAKLDAILDKLDIGEAAPKSRAKKRVAKPASKKRMTTDKTPKAKSAPKPKAKPKKSS